MEDYKEYIDKCFRMGVSCNRNVAKSMLAELTRLRGRVADLEEGLERIKNWAEAYPVKAFPEPDFKKVAEVLKSAGISLDCVSASNMRHVVNRVKEICEQALKETEK